MPSPSKRKVHEYISVESAYRISPTESGEISVDEAYSEQPWQRRMRDVATETRQQMGDEAAQESYVSEQWKDYARAWTRAKYTGPLASDLDSQDPGARSVAEIGAQTRLMTSLSPEQVAQTEAQFKQKFNEGGAQAVVFKEFLKRRHQIGFAYSQNLRRDNPDLGDEELDKKTTSYLRMQGFDSEELEGKLPMVTVAPPPDDDAYWWKATKEVASGLPANFLRGVAEITSTGWKLGLAPLEAASDRELHGERLLAEAPDAYAGWERPLGAPVGQREDNVYRMLRLAHQERMEYLAPVPEVETLPGILASGIGQVIPQLAVLMSGAAATRGLTLAGHTARATAMRSATIGAMWALEDVNAFPVFMQYAAESGIDPHEASATALIGAAAYATVASGLEYFGPFKALESRIPGIQRRLVAMALMGTVEGGTEYLQAIAQEATAYGLNLRELNWKNIQDSLQQAAMEAVIGGIVGGGMGGITFQSPIIETPDGSGVVATDPDAAAAQAIDIVNEVLLPPITDVARMLPSQETVTPEEAYAGQDQEAYQDPRAGELGELREIGQMDQVEIEKGQDIDEMLAPRLALADALGLEKRPWFAKLNGDLMAEVDAAFQANDPQKVRELIPALDEALKNAQAAVETREGKSAVRTMRKKAGLEPTGPLSPIKQTPEVGDAFQGQKPRRVKEQTNPATSLQTSITLSPRAQEHVESVGPVEKNPTGAQSTTPHATYEQGSKNLGRTSRNVWVRPTKAKDNKGRTLLIQWSSDLLQSDTRTSADDYYDSLYQNRDGYARADDFWELPQWIGHAAHNIPDSDVYVVRDIDEAMAFLAESGYADVAFSVLDVNKAQVQQLIAGYEGNVSVGGYASMDAFTGMDNVTVYDKFQDWVTAKGRKWTPGVSYRHFPGTPVVPRVTLSEGCLHGCSFCVVPKVLHQVPTPEIVEQLAAFADLDAELVYVNDKTFGQAPNYTDLIAANEYMRSHNPNFRGFVIQTTAAQMRKFTPEFLHKAGIKFVELGVESYNDSILRANKKPASEKMIDEAVQKLRDADIAFIPNILIGLPQETAETYARTLEFLEANRDIISHFNAYNLAVYAGTEIAEAVGDVLPSDLDENSVAKSFHEDPQLHQDFSDALFALGQDILKAPPISAGSNAQLTAAEIDFESELPEQALPNTIRSDETPEETMKRIEFGLLTEPDEIDLPPEPVSTPEEASRVEDIPDGTPERDLMDGIVDFLKNEQGATAVEETARAVTGGIAGAVGEVSLLRGGIHSLVLDESASLRTTDAGREAVSLLDEAESRHLQMRGGLLPMFDEALAALPRKQRKTVRKWMYAMRDDGQTNWSTLIEHPERVQNIPDGVNVVLEAYRVGVLEVLGDAAAAAKVPQLRFEKGEGDAKGKWVFAPFQRAEGGRYLRSYTQEGMDLMAFQTGHHLWDAFIAWGQAHPDRNPDMDFSNPDKLRAKLDGAKQSGKTKKAGSLEFVRIFKELPVALKDKNGKWIPIQTRDPRSHYLGSVEKQSRRVALWSTATDMLVPRYGTFNEKTSRVEYRQPKMHPELTDVDGLLARLRKDITTQAKNPRAAETAFNTAINNYERSNFGGLEAEFMTSLGESKTGQTLAALHNTALASVLQLAPLFDATNPLRSAGTMGWVKMFKGYGSSLVDMLRHPFKFAAEYQAMGAVIDSHVDWSVHRDTWFSDVFKRNVPQALMAVGRFTEVRGQFTVARMFDRWVQSMNNTGNLRSDQAEFLSKHIRLTADQIAEISRGEMTPSTRAKVIQTGVKTISGLTESSHRKGRIQNSSMGRLAIPFLSVVNSVSRGAVRHTGDLVSDIGSVAKKGATTEQRVKAAKNLSRSAWKMLSFVAAIAGSGFLQRYLRRAVTGRKLVDPEDPESWAAMLAEALAEGGIFGPYYRVFEAAKYSGTPAEIPTKLIFPLGVTIEVATAILGYGKYEDSPWSRRMADLGVQLSPPWKAARNWIARIKYPSREDYYEARKLVRKYNKDERGIEPQYGTGKRNYQYLTVYEAIRDGDREALKEAKDAFWVSAEEKGWDQDDALRRLKSSLSSRRPVNLKEEAREDFLGKLPETARNRVLMEEKRFGDMMERALQPPVEEQ